MKKTLLMALAITAIVGCQKTNPVEPPAVANGDVIALSSGGVTVAQGRAEGDPVANKGIRVDFMVGDQIGLFSAFADVQETPTKPSWAATGLPDAQTGIYFENMPAACTAIASKEAPITLAKFGWGTDGAGGVKIDQIYPKGDANFYLYAYYPYVAADATTIDAATGPKLAVTLNSATPNLQEDILWGVGKSKGDQISEPKVDSKDYISRKDQLAPLTFKHALAQLQFRVYKEKGAQACSFVSIEFTTNAQGTMNITDGTMSVTKMDVTDPLPGTDKTIAAYNIIEKAGELIPELATAGTYTDALEILAKPMMIFPLTNAELKLCKLKITVYYGTGDPDTDTENVKTFVVDLSGVTTTFNQGKKNQLILAVGQTVIALEGEIEAWKDNDANEDSVIPVE